MKENFIIVSSRFKSQATAEIALCIIFKFSTKLKNDFRGQKFTVYEVGHGSRHQEELDMLMSNMRGSTV